MVAIHRRTRESKVGFEAEELGEGSQHHVAHGTSARYKRPKNTVRGDEGGRTKKRPSADPLVECGDAAQKQRGGAVGGGLGSFKDPRGKHPLKGRRNPRCRFSITEKNHGGTTTAVKKTVKESGGLVCQDQGRLGGA